MSWAARRRFIIMSIIGAVAVAFLTVVSIATFYHAPSCKDGIQNQDERGVDCGGPCAYLCTTQTRIPTVLFTKAIASGEGRMDLVASVQNENASAGAKNIPYSIAFYGTGKSSIQEMSGTLDLAPAETVPVYIPNIASGKPRAIRAFLTIADDAPQWFSLEKDPRVKPVVTNTVLAGTTSAPRIDATLTNASVTALSNIQVIVFVHSVQGDIIAASKTIVPLIPAQGQATATFTWNSAFTEVPARIDVMPIIPLP